LPESHFVIFLFEVKFGVQGSQIASLFFHKVGT